MDLVADQESNKKLSPLVRRPEELVYRACYAPTDLQAMLGSSETRSKIRRLPAPQLFFSLKELDDSEMVTLLPHLTEEQWTAILDLDLWTRDRMSTGAFLHWLRHLVEAEDAVARKILRATDDEHWLSVFSKNLQVFGKTEEDEFEGEPDEGREVLMSPDGFFLIGLPRHSEKARLLREVLIRLYQLEPDVAAALLNHSRFGTPLAFEEDAYQNRRRRIEDMGFQDYFDAIDIYTPRTTSDAFPEKDSSTSRGQSTLPSRVIEEEGRTLLLMRCLSALSLDREIQPIIEELFFVCNKVLSADRTSPAEPKKVKRAIRKTISGISLGLDVYSDGDFGRAVEGLSSLYLVSLFQIGYSEQLRIQQRARKILERKTEADSFEQAYLKGLSRKYPILIRLKGEKVRYRFFDSLRDIKEADHFLENVHS